MALQSVKAYPDLRHLGLLESLGPQGVVTSICPGQLAEPGVPDFGHRPAVRSIVEQMAKHL
jgi:hypothetical protein